MPPVISDGVTCCARSTAHQRTAWTRVGRLVESSGPRNTPADDGGSPCECATFMKEARRRCDANRYRWLDRPRLAHKPDRKLMRQFYAIQRGRKDYLNLRRAIHSLDYLHGGKRVTTRAFKANGIVDLFNDALGKLPGFAGNAFPAFLRFAREQVTHAF